MATQWRGMAVSAGQVLWPALAAMLCLVTGVAAAAPAVPAALSDWRGWALHDAPEAGCSVIAESGQCQWPGELRLDVGPTGLSFSQSWTLQAQQHVPLPGDAAARPLDVRVNGVAAPVVLRAGLPTLLLPAGEHRVDGRIAWARRPATLVVPDSIALLSLRVDGADVASPERNEDGALVLGGIGEDQSDALQIETHRLLADGVPQMLLTSVSLSVSGSPREQVLGTVLPAGFVPVLVDGDIPVRVDPDGTLRAQLRAGFWQVLVIARATAPMTHFTVPAQASAEALLPAQEIWQFHADAYFRLAQLTGVAGVDPAQTGMPDWEDVLAQFDIQIPQFDALLQHSQTLPTFLLEPQAQATLTEQLRGLPPQRAPRLHLQRELWLNFDGDGYLARDSISGELGSAQRLDMRAPWQLESATRDGAQALLVTDGADAGLSGTEQRDPAVSLQTSARAARDGALPANGWTVPFDSANALLHLPPGYRLLAATGADRAAGSWWDRWSLLDVFLLSLFGLMAWRLGGVALGAALVGWFLLAWHEPLAPRVSLLSAVALSLLMRHLPAGRVATVLGWVRNGMLVVAALLVLPFAADQLRMALHPQLEHPAAQVDGMRGGMGSAPTQAEYAAPMEAMAPPPPPAPSVTSDSGTLDRIAVTGSRIKRIDLFSYPADTIAQAGSARAAWSWHDHPLQWNGPLLTEESLGLIISPPWATRLWRVLAVLLIGVVLWQLLRTRRVAPGGSERRTIRVPATVTGLLLASVLGAVLSPPPAHAAEAGFPSLELLDQLRTRLLSQTPACAPECAGLTAAAVSASASGLTLQLDAQAQADTAWPLPRPDASLRLLDAQVDGEAAAVLSHGGGQWIVLERGVHRVALRYAASGERWRIAFPLAPATLDLQAEGFDIAGLDHGRLIGDTLELVPPRAPPSDGTSPDASAPSETVPPFVRVIRDITFDQQWSATTRVQRIAPMRSGLSVAVTLLPGEQVLSARDGASVPPVRDGVARVSLPAGVDVLQWDSRLTPAAALQLVAGDGRSYAEEWLLNATPLLHAEISGIPEAGQDADSDGHRFLPLPGETLDIAITRPAAVAGASVAIDSVMLHVDPGQHARNSTLDVSLRATRAGQHILTLPADAELLSLSIDDVAQPLIADGGRVNLPLRTQPQRIQVRWRDAVEIGTRMQSPQVALGASVSNLHISMTVPQDRWLLFTAGPRVGPAVLYWSTLAVVLLVAMALTRFGGTPLRLHEWLLLGLGFSALSWWPAVLVAGWLLLIGWRSRQTTLLQQHTPFMLLQMLLVLVTAVALLCLLLAIPYGLLGQPDMSVTGNNSYGGMLRWFADRSADGALPTVSAITLPLWCYKLAILLWSLWLANALMRWLRWGWASFGRGGMWPPRKPKSVDTTPPAATPPTAP